MSSHADRFGISEALMALILEGLNQGLQIAEEGRKVTPFMLTESAITVLATDTMEEAFAVVHDVIASNTVEHCVLVYDSYLTTEGERTDAIVIEGYERGRDKGVRFAQRYTPAMKTRLFGKGRPLQRLGNLKFLAGDVEYRTA